MSASILVALDLAHEEVSAGLLKRAAQIADLDEAQLSVVTVVPDFGTSFVASFFEEDAMKAALAKVQESLHAFVDRTLPNHRPYRHIVASGSAYEEILKAAETIGADMIVIGASKPDLSTYLLGPNAAPVARHFAGSVLIVR